jgi:hypothetical protein
MTTPPLDHDRIERRHAARRRAQRMEITNVRLLGLLLLLLIIAVVVWTR